MQSCTSLSLPGEILGGNEDGDSPQGPLPRLCTLLEAWQPLFELLPWVALPTGPWNVYFRHFLAGSGHQCCEKLDEKGRPGQAAQ